MSFAKAFRTAVASARLILAASSVQAKDEIDAASEGD